MKARFQRKENRKKSGDWFKSNDLYLEGQTPRTEKITVARVLHFEPPMVGKLGGKRDSQW